MLFFQDSSHSATKAAFFSSDSPFFTFFCQRHLTSISKKKKKKNPITFKKMDCITKNSTYWGGLHINTSLFYFIPQFLLIVKLTFFFFSLQIMQKKNNFQHL